MTSANVERQNAQPYVGAIGAIWIPITALDHLPIGSQTVFRHDNRRIAMFRPTRDEIYALDDQCPHEGYPLSKGSVAGDVLTCCWHNYKFDLKNGRCLKGDEDVRWYATRVSGEMIEIQVADESADVLMHRYTESLEAALFHRRIGQVARDVVRLLKTGVEPRQLALLAVRYDAEHAEYGSGHALPVAVDVLSMLDRYSGIDAALPLLQAFELVSESNIRLPKRPVPSAIDPGHRREHAESEFRRYVEEERIDEAEGLLRGALAKGWGRETVEPWLIGLCIDHFLGFGHALIYTIKAFDLLEIVGFEHASAVLPGVLVSTINQTREDVLPEWDWFRRRLSAFEPRLEHASMRRREQTSLTYDTALITALLDGHREEAFDSIAAALEGESSIDTIVNALSVAASRRILHFDVAIDRDHSVQEGWLDVTHLLTFANATRYALQRCRSPAAFKLLFQAARFINNAKPLDRKTAYPTEIPSQRSEDISRTVIVDAIRRQQPREALVATTQYFEAGLVPGDLEAALQDLILEDHATRPIVVGHLIKTCRAAFDEFDRLPEGQDRSQPVLAFVRMAASPIRERWIARFVHEAIRFVDEGKVPRTLT